MTIVSRPSSVPSLLGGSIELPVHACGHEPRDRGLAVDRRARARAVASPSSAPGKMGLPLAAQFASPRLARHRRRRPAGGRRRDQRRPVARRRGARPGGARVASAHAARPPRARRPTAPRRPRASDVVVLIVPVMLDDEQQPDYRYMDAAVDVDRARASTRARWSSSRRRCRSATRAAGSRRASRRSAACGPTSDFFVAFSPERLYSGAALRNLATYPKLVGGIGDGVDRPRGRLLRRASSTPRSWRCRTPRPPSSRSSPTRRTAT